MLEARKWQCKVISNNNVATFIKELVIGLPEGETVDFKAGGYIQIEVPPHTLEYQNFEIDERFLADWTKFKMFQYKSHVYNPVTRAYSMANYPGEKGIIKLNVRIASPPPGKDGTSTRPGFFLCLQPPSRAMMSLSPAPLASFSWMTATPKSSLLAAVPGWPLYAAMFLIFSKAKQTKRKVSFWYGGRSLKEVFYTDEFLEIEKNHDNFSFHLALSDPLPEDNWTGHAGFIHMVLFDQYLKDHPAPEDVNYYLCGPPMMNQAVFEMLDNLGVEQENIHFDDFGG